MSEVRPTYDNEIDLLEFLEILWDGKWLLSAFVALAALVGFGYLQVSEPKYKVTVPYNSNIYSVSAQQICVFDVDCMDSKSIVSFLFVAEDGWNKNANRKSLSLTTSAPFDQNHYEVQLGQANTTLTNQVYEEAKNELVLIQTELIDGLLSTEIVATNLLNAKRIIQSIDNGQSALSFGSVSIEKSSPKVPLILVLSVILGVLVGMIFIIIDYARTKRKEHLAKA